ncbi:MAG TPA: hypothetical protein PKI61_01760 [bacterium]|nr:hypothetical protein [bacterium]HPT30145.1 hypothetical protein [bacterium]
MRNLERIALISLFSLLAILPGKLLAQTEIDPNFRPGNIISDEEILNCNGMSLGEIQTFLEKKGSFLANYTTYNAHGTFGKSAAQIIYEAATANYDCEGVEMSDTPDEAEKQLKCRRVSTVNPKFLLVLLQKEQSLIENSAPTARQLDWATGYGCPDGWTCNPYYQGFGKQINSAALQFRYYIDHPNEFKYQPGNTYTFTNPYGTIINEPMAVTIENRATAGLYNYTPHVFNGNYNFYKLWQSYFPGGSRRTYPDGSLLKTSTQPVVFLIENGQKKPFANMGALSTRFDINKIITVSPEVLEQYEPGGAIKYPNYSLIKTPEKKIYLLVDGNKRLIESDAVFRKIGFSSEELVSGTMDDLAAYATTTTITATSTYPLGALIMNTKNGGVYYVSEGQKAPIVDKVLLSTKFRGRRILKATEADLAKYPKISPVLFDSGELLKSNNAQAVYLIDNGQKRPFLSGSDFESLGYNWDNVITVSPQMLYLYPEGEAVKQ